MNCGPYIYENSKVIKAFRCFKRKNFARSRVAEVDKQLQLLKEKTSRYTDITFYSLHQHLPAED